MTEKIKVESSAAALNRQVAAANREQFGAAGVTVLNMISSPGSGKTSLLEKMAARYGSRLAVVTGDIQMTYDADRISAAGSKAIQIETGGSCHLSAQQVQDAAAGLDLGPVDFLVIENIGNLVCPSTFDLGEDLKLAVLSVTEGDEKPIKYPALFTRADAVIINKTDLMEHVDFDAGRAADDCRKLNKDITVLKTSCKTGGGLEELFAYLEKIRAGKSGG